MNSITKRELSEIEIKLLVKVAFSSNKIVDEITKLEDGYFNNSYLLKFTDQNHAVLKVAPSPDVKVLTYEKCLMKNEVSALRKMFAKNMPVPEVLFYDGSKSIIDSDYFFMTYLVGMPMDKIKSKLSDEQINSIHRSLGKIFNTLLDDKYNLFGEVDNPEKQYSSWLLCFKSMMTDLMDDAFRIDLKLPIDKHSMLELIENFSEDLSLVTCSSLVHKDLWDGNIFISTETSKITGIIDTERAIYADPLMEVICGHYSAGEDFFNNYYNKSTLDKNEKNRVLLYQLYLYLLMVIECPYRKYADNGQYNWASDMLLETLDKLNIRCNHDA